jgi:hypothetical protein
MQVLVCEPSLGKVGDGWLARDEIFLYYGTDF